MGADACSEGLDGRLNWSEGVLALRRSVVRDNHWSIAAVERDLSDRLFQQSQRQVGTPCRNPGVQIIRAATFHDPMNTLRRFVHRISPKTLANRFYLGFPF